MSSAEPDYSAFDYVRSFISISVFFLILLIFTPFILLGLILSFGKFSNFVVENIAPVIARITMFISGIRFRVKKHTATIPSPAVYIVNHGSTLDVLTILALGLPRVRFVAKWQFQYNPIFLLLGRLTGQVFIRREKSDKAVETLQKNVERIHRQQLSVLMAPEGSRSHDGIIGPFKKGPFRMAIDLNYPIVPIYFEGNRELSSGKFMITKKGTCTAHVYPPIETSHWSIGTLQSHIEEVRLRYLHWADIHKKNS